LGVPPHGGIAAVPFQEWWDFVHLSSRTILIGTEIRVSLSPAWTYFFWGFLLLGVFNLALAGVNLMRPYWTGLRASLRLVSDGLGCVLFCWFLKANILAEIACTACPRRQHYEFATEQSGDGAVVYHGSRLLHSHGCDRRHRIVRVAGRTGA